MLNAASSQNKPPAEAPPKSDSARCREKAPAFSCRKSSVVVRENLPREER
jgi:hypothetical protein